MVNKVNLLLLSVLLFSSLNAKAIYLGGSAGHSYSLEKSSFKNHSTGSLWLGFNPLPFLKAEGMVKYNKHLLVGGGGRLTIFPFINLVGGVVHRHSLEKGNQPHGNGFYAGPSFNFNILPVIDLFADAKYFVVSGDKSADAEVGLRIHF